MNNGIKDLFPSLVGSSIEFRFRNALVGASTIEESISSAKKRIASNTKLALSTGGELCVMLLSELTSFYSKEPYYMAVRGSIEMRRYRPAVLEYMKLSVQERADRLKSALSEKLRGDKNRELKIEALRYFVSTYPGRLKEFKSLLTREEFLIVA